MESDAYARVVDTLIALIDAFDVEQTGPSPLATCRRDPIDRHRKALVEAGLGELVGDLVDFVFDPMSGQGVEGYVVASTYHGKSRRYQQLVYRAVAQRREANRAAQAAVQAEQREREFELQKLREQRQHELDLVRLQIELARVQGPQRGVEPGGA